MSTKAKIEWPARAGDRTCEGKWSMLPRNPDGRAKANIDGSITDFAAPLLERNLRPVVRDPELGIRTAIRESSRAHPDIEKTVLAPATAP